MRVSVYTQVGTSQMSVLSEEKVLIGKPSYNSYSQTIAVIGPVDEVITTNLTVTTINGQSYPPPPGTGFVTLTGVETLSNKSLIDNSTWIVDVTDPTKRIAFDAAGSASTTTTLRATQTANRIYTMPDMGADTNFMFTGGSQTVTGTKSFSAGTMRVVNSGDATVYTTLTTGTAPAGTVTTLATTGMAASRTYNIIDAGTNTEFLLGAATQTVSGTKTFTQSARMARTADPTIYMQFLPGASPTGTVTTIATAVQTGSYTYTIPNAGANSTFVLADAAQTLTSKNLVDSGTFFVDNADPTIRLAFDATGTTGTTATIRTQQTAGRTYTVPNGSLSSDFFVLAAASQSLTNKTITDTTNTVAAKQLVDATGVVDVSASAAPAAGDVLTATSATTATWQASTVTFSDATFAVYDAVDPTIQVKFDAAGTTGTTTTITTSQTANSVFTFPNTTTTDDIVLADATQNLTNKGFASDTTYFYNPAVPTKRISFDPSGLNAGVTYTIRAAAGAASRVFSLPNTANDTFALIAATQTLTNKTITGTTNNVSAASLRTATGAVTVSAATAPTAGQVLTATSATVANWQTPASAPTTFSDTTFAIYDNVDNTKQILFDAAGTAATTATIRSAQTASRIYTIPDAVADDSFVLLTPAQTLTNKTITSTTNTVAAKQLIDATGVVDVSASAAPTVGQTLIATSATTATWQTPASAPTTFSDAAFAIYDSVDNTKQILFDAAGTAATTATIRSAQTASRIYTIPDAVADDSFVLLTPTQTLTNKTITDVTNTVAAKQLIDSTGVVDVSASAAPTAGQILVASSATVAAWATPDVTTVTGILPVANGGTGVNTLTSNGVLVGAGTSAVTTTKAAPTGAFVGTTDSQTLTNKNLSDTTTFVTDATDATIRIGFNAAGTTGTTTTLRATQTATRVITIPSGGVAADVMLTEGAQTANGVNTFTAGILTPTITETVANAGTAINSVNVRTVVSAGVNVGVVEATAANSYLALLVTGTGAITAQIPNSAVSGGNVRGTNAVDFQMVRSSATFVAAGTNSGILCGNSNRVAAAGNAVIGGGNTNLIGGGATNSGILCGLTNTINSNILQGVICGGARNTSAANFSGVLAGDSNTASGARSAVSGGNGNTASGSNSSISGGDTNAAASTGSFIGGGANNTIASAATLSSICTGSGNGISATGVNAFVGGGSGNTAVQANCAVVSGVTNTASGARNFIGAGTNNQTTGQSSVVCGGETNTCPGGDYQFIGGGTNNRCDTQYSVVCGGFTNWVKTTSYGAICGGNTNTVTGNAAFIGAGTTNTASGGQSTVLGGILNAASGLQSIVCGGNTNTASGINAAILYGVQCTASGDYSAAFGRQAQSTAQGGLTIADSQAATVTNANIDRMVTRFNDGYRLIGAGALRLNNAQYTYSNLLCTSSGASTNTNITNGTINIPTNCAIRFELRMQGQTTTPGTIFPAGNAGVHVMYLDGYAGVDTPSTFGATLSSTTNTNYTNANLAASVLNFQVLTAPFRLRFRINTPGVYDTSYTWAGSVTFYINDTNAPDPV